MERYNLISGLKLLMPKWQAIFKDPNAGLFYPSKLLGYVSYDKDRFKFRFNRLPRKLKKQVKLRYNGTKTKHPI
jgi:hypothetical protein